MNKYDELELLRRVADLEICIANQQEQIETLKDRLITALANRDALQKLP